MNYYDELIDKILSLKDSDKARAMSLIENELNAPYVPKDIYNKLIDIKKSIYIEKEDVSISPLTLLSYLYENDEKQMFAAYHLDEVNLREYIEQISEYLKSDGLLEAKISIIISLIKQEVNKELVINKNGYEYSFNPINLTLIENNKLFIEVSNLLNNYYMKSPDKLALSKELLYKEIYYLMPIVSDSITSDTLFNKIIKVIEDSFN